MNQSICRICGRPLKSLNSIMSGIGPVCGGGGKFHSPKRKSKKDNDRGRELFDNHAEYSVIRNEPDFVYIIDTGGNAGKRTVTNDADFVIQDLSDFIDNFENKRVFYTDTEGRINEMLHNGNRFLTFKAGHEGVVL